MITSRGLALVFGCVMAAAAGQPPADFSGEWTVKPPAASNAGPGAAPARGDMGSGWGSTIRITQDANHLTVEPIIYSRYDLQPQPRLVYAFDGSETRATLMMGRGFQEQTSRAVWEGTSLTITTMHAFTDPASGKPLTTAVTQKLLLESPTTLVVEVTRSGALGGAPSNTRTVFTK